MLQTFDGDKATIYRLNSHFVAIQQGHTKQRSALQFQNIDLTIFAVP